jgi:hypothetical protein
MTQSTSGSSAAMPVPSQPFRNWQRALNALNAAEAHGAPHGQVVRLAANVIRTRNAMTIDRLIAGWEAPTGVLRRLAADQRLLAEADDADDAERLRDLDANAGHIDDAASELD